MAGIPQTFTQLSPVLANYNFVELGSGTGYITFYPADTVDLYLLSNNTFYSNTIVHTATAVNGAAVLAFDHDYDAVLNRPLDIKGLGIVNIPLLATSAGGSPSNSNTYAVVTLRKWDGTTETDIATNQSTTHTVSAAAGTAYYRMTATDLNIPLTHFKKGETLRLTIQIYIWTNNVNATNGYAHDPMSRTTGWDTTGAVPSRLTFQCPVRLNL